MSQTVAPARARQADLLAQYELLRRLGGSDRASVHLARDRVLGQQVAIKLFRDEYSRDPDRIARLYAIGRNAAGLGQGAISGVYDHGASWHAAFITSEWIEGRDLAAVLDSEGPVPPRRAATIIAQVLDTLIPTHAAGLLHGDLHPHNVLLRGETDRVALTDFGAGSLFPAHAGAAYAPYSAPELALTSAADIFATGALLRALLTPRVDEGTGGQTGALLAIADRATALDPAARYPDAGAMRAAIESVVGPLARPSALVAPAPTPVAPLPQTLPTQAAPRAYSRRALLVLLGGLLVGGAAGTGLLVRSRQDAAPLTPTVGVGVAEPTATTASATAESGAVAPTAPASEPTAQPTAQVAAPPSAPPATVAPTAAPTATVAPTTTPAPAATTAPAAAPTATARPAVGYTATFDVNWIENAYRRNDGVLYGRPTVALYSVGTGYERGIITFNISDTPTVPILLRLTGLDDERAAQTRFRITLNGATIFDGVTGFPNVPTNDVGVGGADRYWGQMTLPVPAGVLRAGENKLTLENTTPGGAIGVPYILINSVQLAAER